MIENQTPFVSVIAPCRNEIKYIDQAVYSILNGDYPKDKMELIIVDGMSDDGTRERLAEIELSDDRITVLDNNDIIQAVAMNKGLDVAKGEYIVRIDCHSQFADDYVRRSVEVAQRTNADLVGGYIVTRPGAKTETAKAICSATSTKFGIGGGQFRLTGGEKEVDTVPFGTFKKDIFKRVGYYDERLVRNEDLEMSARIRKAGGKIIISPQIKVEYYNRASFKGLSQQAFNNALWNPYTIWLVGYGPSLRHFIPGCFITSLILLVILSFFNCIFGMLAFAEFVIYLSAAVFFAKRTSSDHDVSFWRVLASFIILHFSYGLATVYATLSTPFKFRGSSRSQIGKPTADRIE